MTINQFVKDFSQWSLLASESKGRVLRSQLASCTIKKSNNQVFKTKG